MKIINIAKPPGDPIGWFYTRVDRVPLPSGDIINKVWFARATDDKLTLHGPVESHGEAIDMKFPDDVVVRSL